MKLKFKNQDFQTDAVNAVCDLFLGQEKRHSSFEISKNVSNLLLQNEFGIGNAKFISDNRILENMNKIQKRNNLPYTDDLAINQFCIEMETGTGKTYVYTKTIFELNKRYGFTKFIIVVPSVAIREGVNKSLEMTNDHFLNQYNNVPYRYFIYNSKKLSNVRQFAVSNNIEIMIINIDAFKKSENIINQIQDKLNGEAAIRYIQDCNPIVIVDEPQSVDNTPKAKEAIQSLNPLCVLRYSATHKEKMNLLYRLTPVDAYNMGLVKQICVSSNRVENDFNKPYIKLLSVSSKDGFKAKLEIHAKKKDGKVESKIVTVSPADDLFVLSGSRDLYSGYQIIGIDCTAGFESVEFSNTEYLKLGKTIGSVDENLIKEAQIKRTIEAHFTKEMMLNEKGIKVLSLFFIDEVQKYRTVNGEKGIYAKIFEKCYNELLELPKYSELKKRYIEDVSKVHNGYFSQDKKGSYKDTKGNTLVDDDTYNTIMKDKEWLLSFDCPLRFIFSHSTLKEGWDNPNVFQVCTLIEQKSVFTCRQKIGRGLRLCVDQNGNRIEDKNINVLHVMANESFTEFVETLQKEIEQETGVEFGILNLKLFDDVTYEEKLTREKEMSYEEAKLAVNYMKEQGFITEDGNLTETGKTRIIDGNIGLPAPIDGVESIITKIVEKNEDIREENIMGKKYIKVETVEKKVDARELISYLENKRYILKSGKITESLRSVINTDDFELPPKYDGAREKLKDIIRQADNRPPIRDASKEVVVKLKNQVLLSQEFKDLWDKIKQKTAYRVNINTEELVKKCVKDLREMEKIPKAKLVSEIAELQIENSGISYFERAARTMDIEVNYESLPNILGIISEETLIKKSTIKRILDESDRKGEFLDNPQAFLEKVLEIIKMRRHELAIDGIKYVKINESEYYIQDIFDSNELFGNITKNAIKVEHSVYDHVIFDSSTVEKPFALALDNDPEVKLFLKIPRNFKIDTPIGTYNPDWAVYMNRDGLEKLYFIIETKGTTALLELRETEKLKIHCGKEHFKALQNGVSMHVAKDWKEFKLNN